MEIVELAGKIAHMTDDELEKIIVMYKHNIIKC